jgi:hypothetical protein
MSSGTYGSGWMPMEVRWLEWQAREAWGSYSLKRGRKGGQGQPFQHSTQLLRTTPPFQAIVRLWQHGPRLLRALLSLACLLLASSTPRPLQLFDVVIDVEQEMRKSAEISEDIFDEAYTYRTFYIERFPFTVIEIAT